MTYGLTHEWDEPVFADRDPRLLPAYRDPQQWTFGVFDWGTEGRWVAVGGVSREWAACYLERIVTE